MTTSQNQVLESPLRFCTALHVAFGVIAVPRVARDRPARQLRLECDAISNAHMHTSTLEHGERHREPDPVAADVAKDSDVEAAAAELRDQGVTECVASVGGGAGAADGRNDVVTTIAHMALVHSALKMKTGCWRLAGVV